MDTTQVVTRGCTPPKTGGKEVVEVVVSIQAVALAVSGLLLYAAAPAPVAVAAAMALGTAALFGVRRRAKAKE